MDSTDPRGKHTGEPLLLAGKLKTLSVVAHPQREHSLVVEEMTLDSADTLELSLCTLKENKFSLLSV
jgi:hypothetical protein